MAVNMGTAIAYLELDTSKFSKGFVSAYNDLKVFGDKSATAEQKLKGLSSAFKTTGGMLSKSVTLPLVGVGAAAIKTATDFEAGMSEVKAISGATATEFDALRDKAIEMGAKTKFSASDSAAAFKYMAMAGWDVQSMMDGIAGIMDLAAASGEDLATTSDIVTDALTAFGLQASDSAHFADVLAQASSKSNTNVDLMGETFKYVAPVAGALGYSIEDTAVAIGLMANSGIKGSQAGTALRATFTRLTKPTEAVAIAMEKYNISLTDSQGNIKPLSTLMLELRDRFSGLSDSQKTSLAATLAGQEAMSGLLAIVNASDEDFQKLTDEINNANGAAQDMADIMMDNTAGAIEQLKGALESAGILIGEKLTPYIRQLAEWITGLVEKFNAMSEEQQDLIIKIGLFIAAIGPALLILSKVISVVASIIKVIGIVKGVLLPIINAVFLLKNGVTTAFLAMEGFSKGAIVVAKGISLLLNPITLVIAAIGALVGVFVYLYKTNEDFRNKVIEVWETIKEAIGNAIENISLFFTETLPETFNSAVEAIASFVNGVIEFFTVTIPEAFNTFVNETIPNAINSIVQWFEQLPYMIGYAIGTVIGYFYNLGTSIREWITTELPPIIEGVIQWFAQLPGRIWEWLVNVVTNVIKWGAEMYNNAVLVASNFLTAVVTWISQLPSRIWTWLTTTVSNVISWGANMIAQARQTASRFVSSFISFIASLPSKVWGIVSQIPSKVLEIGGQLKQAGEDILNKLWDGIKSVGESILGWISDFAGKIGDFVSGIVDGFKNIVSGANDAKSAARSVDGKHAGGLDYVPYNGYVAELHEGERVLTKQENREYNRNGGIGNTGSGDTFVFYNTKPDPYQYAKQMKRAKRELMEGF